MKGIKKGILYKRVQVIAFIAATSPFVPVSAQDKQVKDTLSVGPAGHKKDSLQLRRITQQEDAMDIVKKVFKAKKDVKADSANLQPGVLYPSILPALGYTVVNGGTATVGVNISFYTDSINTTNLSTISASPLVSLLHQYTLPIISSVFTKNNKINFLGDWRYYKYPSFTYGLGGYTSLSDADLIDYSYIKFNQEVLYHLGHDFYAGVGYDFEYHFNMVNDGPDNASYEAYPNTNLSHTTSSGFVAHIKYDSRTNINNPREAVFGSIIYRYNTPLLGSDNEWQSVQIELRKYFKVGKRENVLGFWSWNEFTFGGTVPYFDLPSTGWDTYANSGRGYIQGRYRGTSLAYLEGEYRFQITNNGLLGGVVFLNGETVPEYPSNKFETINTGEGIGLRIKMNRYSDTNLCIDYAFGNGGSQGIFFNLGEVF